MVGGIHSLNVMHFLPRIQAQSQVLPLPQKMNIWEPLASLSFWNSWARVALLSVRSSSEAGGEEQIKSGVSGALVR
jgi:hypothetical protein